MSQIQGSFAYDGKEFNIVEEDTIVQLGGNHIILWNISTGAKDYIACPRRNGYSCVTTSPNNGLIAAAESGLNPSCHIYQMPGKRLIAEFKMKTTLKSLGMAFSRDGHHLVIIGGLPDFNISIYDLENKKFLRTEEHKLKYKSDFLSVKFNPRSKNEFCILSEQKVQFYNVLPAFQFLDGADGANEVESEGGQNNFIDAWRYQIQEFDAMDVPVEEGSDARVGFTAVTWDGHNRVFLCTNQEKLFHLASQNPHIGKTLDLQSTPLATLMTPKHLIVSESNGMISWYRIEQPFENAKPEEKFITIEEKQKEYNFQAQLPEDATSPANYMIYTHSHQNMLIGTFKGLLSLLNVPSEKVSEEDYDNQEEVEQKQQVLDNPLQTIGRFHTARVNGVKPLGTSTQMVSISADRTVALWEITTHKQLSVIHMPVEPISIDVSREGSVMFIGTEAGTFRIYDITNRERPRLIQQLKFYEEEKPISTIKSSEDGKLVLISSDQSELIFVMSQEASTGFDIFGQIRASGLILSVGYHLHDNEPVALAVLSNNLVECYKLPTSVYENRLEPLPQSYVKSAVRKVDPGSDLIITNQFTKHYMVSGEDNVLKAYEHYPTDSFEKIDWKKPAVKPGIELKDSHALGTCVSDSSGETKLIVTGGRDGMINVRSSDIQPGHDQYECIQTFSAFSVHQGGVQCLSLDTTGQFVFSAGGDGSIMIHSIGNSQLPRREVPFENSVERDTLAKLPEAMPQNISELQTVTERMIVEFQKVNEARKRNFRNEIMKELNGIRDNLRELLDENQRVTDIEKLDRDEFVIDVVRKANLEKQGDDLCADIRKKCEVTSLTMMLLKERCTNSTWEQMEIQSEACKSIQSDKLIFNYAIRKRTPQEYRLLKQLILQRKIELRQKLARMEQKLREVVDEADFCGFENYIQNRVTGKPQFMDDDSIAEAARIFEETRARKLKEKNDKLNNVNLNELDGSGKLKPILTITKGKLGTKTRKRDPEEEARLAALANKGNARDIKGMEEIHWRIVQTKRSIDDIKASIESDNIFEMLYEPYDLYRDKRKRAQIEFIKEVVFELKRDFNKEFEQLKKFKNDHQFAISEKNEQIRDLQENLQVPIDLERFETDLAERPEHIFEIDEKTEIQVERYYNAQQRAEMEEAERKRLEKEALLQGDNMGQRGLKMMLGGNELIMKKEKNKMDEEFVREEWMNKPVEEMNEDEKQRLKEFEQRVLDSKLKQKKQWEVNLHRVKQEIVEIKAKFEEQLFGLYKKRIFYEARIQEQELQIIRLTIALHDVKETALNVVKFRDQYMEQEEVYQKKRDFVQICNDQCTDFDTHMKNDKGFQEQESRAKTMCQQEDLDTRKILQFIKAGKPNCRVVVPPEQVEKMKSHIILLDPYSEIDAEVVQKKVTEMQNEEVYDFERDRHMFAEVLQNQFESIVHERQMRIKMKQLEEKNKVRLNNLRDFIGHLDREKNDILQKFESTQMRFKKAVDRQEKLKFNFEVVVYMKQGQVEVPQLPVATDYKDAILVQTNVVNRQNDDIKRKGDTKVKQMEEILKHNTKLKQIKYEVKRLTLQIEDYKERALDVQLYRVTKKTQEIIQGKYQKKDEEDKKRLESQIKQLEQNSTNRLKTFAGQRRKLEQEIKDKKRENAELESKARDLRRQVDQRQQIIDLKSATSNDNASDPHKRIMNVANQRKMLDVIKQQEEEIIFLKDELDRLRARTFPSFAHIQNKADYPDER